MVTTWRALSSWVLGYPETASAHVDYVLKDAREIGQAATLMFGMANTLYVPICCGNFAAANAQADELVGLADEKGASLWKAVGLLNQGCVLGMTGKASDAVQKLTSAFTAYQSTGATLSKPWYLSYLAKAYAECGQFDDAWRTIGAAQTAFETSNERWCEANILRMTGEIALMSPGPDPAKAEAYFERALAVARAQKAKSWELRAAMSMARLWRDQGKPQEAHDLLAPVYGWFTEGFDTSDLKEAKVLLAKLPDRPGALPSGTKDQVHEQAPRPRS
jgi:predicted ATPase